jgi:succinoglycan biosynthesis protein ExoO
MSVTVILPTYNSAPFVSRAIDSVLGQQGDHRLELIIVDDCSTDVTVQLIKQRYGADARVKVIVSERNGGPGIARNLALAEAKGDWIALIDADDAWTADRLSALLSVRSPKVDVLFDNIMGFDQTAGVETGLLFPSLPPQMTVTTMAADPAPGSKFNFGYLKPLIRRDFLRRVNVKYPEIRISEDLLFYLEVLIKGARTKTTSDAFYVYTTSVGKVSGRRSTLSASIPDPELVSRLLDALAAKYRDELNADEFSAITSRAERLRRLAPLDRLYDHLSRRRYLAAALQCLADRAVRKQAFQALAKRLPWMA